MTAVRPDRGPGDCIARLIRAADHCSLAPRSCYPWNSLEQPEANWQRISHVSHDHRVRGA